MPRWTIMINYHIAFVDNLQPIIDEMMYKKNRTVLITYNSNSACSSVRLFHRRCFLLYLKRFSLVPTYICEMCKSPTICIKRIELHHMFNYFLKSFFFIICFTRQLLNVSNENVGSILVPFWLVCLDYFESSFVTFDLRYIDDLMVSCWMVNRIVWINTESAIG